MIVQKSDSTARFLKNVKQEILIYGIFLDMKLFPLLGLVAARSHRNEMHLSRFVNKKFLFFPGTGIIFIVLDKICNWQIIFLFHRLISMSLRQPLGRSTKNFFSSTQGDQLLEKRTPNFDSKLFGIILKESCFITKLSKERLFISKSWDF